MVKDKNQDGPAFSKRLKISKTQQQTLLITIITAVILGVCLVLGIYFVKYIKFNGKVIAAKDEAIADYEKTIKNVGLCRDTNNDGKFSEDELKKCNPDALDSALLPGTLRYNVMVNMANNKDLESVARESLSDCYDASGEKIDWQKKFDETENDEEQAKYLAMLKMCSSLRVIPDALPAQANEEALMASLNQIFIVSGWEPEAISPSGDIKNDTEGLSTIPVSLSVQADTATTMRVLDNIEKSIRTFELQTANISWSGDRFLALESQGTAYYTEDSGVVESNQTVYATDAAKKKAGSKQ